MAICFRKMTKNIIMANGQMNELLQPGDEVYDLIIEWFLT
jgi:hypothetical protein